MLLKTIRKDAFACCYNLKEIEAKKAIPNTDKKAFYDVPYIMVKCRSNSSAEKWAKKIISANCQYGIADKKTFEKNINYRLASVHFKNKCFKFTDFKYLMLKFAQTVMLKTKLSKAVAQLKNYEI